MHTDLNLIAWFNFEFDPKRSGFRKNDGVNTGDFGRNDYALSRSVLDQNLSILSLSKFTKKLCSSVNFEVKFTPVHDSSDLLTALDKFSNAAKPPHDYS